MGGGSCRFRVKVVQLPYTNLVEPLRVTYRSSGTLRGRYMSPSTTTTTASTTYTATSTAASIAACTTTVTASATSTTTFSS